MQNDNSNPDAAEQYLALLFLECMRGLETCKTKGEAQIAEAALLNIRRRQRKTGMTP